MQSGRVKYSSLTIYFLERVEGRRFDDVQNRNDLKIYRSNRSIREQCGTHVFVKACLGKEFEKFELPQSP